MKKIYILGFILLLIHSKSYSQTRQFPFYGYELSNYEVGDSLEYYTDMWASGNFDYSAHTLYCVIAKQLLAGNDSIRYTIKTISNGLQNVDNSFHSSYSVDTVTRAINNDTVYKNDNNLLGFLLNAPPDTGTVKLGPKDSAYIKFDTINAYKRLRYEYLIFNGEDHAYEAEENIGVESWYSDYEDQGATNSSGNLEFYHLAHGGISGTLQNIYDNVKQPDVSKSDVSVRYDNGNPVLFISSNQNLLPTVIIYDLLGRALETVSVNIGSSPINLNSFAKGIYLYKVTSNGNVLGQGKLMNL